MVGARDAVTQAQSRAAIAKKIEAEKKRLEMEKAKQEAATLANPEGADGVDAKKAGKGKSKGPVQVREASREVKKLVLGLGSQRVRAFLTYEDSPIPSSTSLSLFPALGVNPNTSAESIRSLYHSLLNTLVPTRNDVISALTSATTVANVTSAPKLPKVQDSILPLLVPSSFTILIVIDR